MLERGGSPSRGRRGDRAVPANALSDANQRQAQGDPQRRLLAKRLGDVLAVHRRPNLVQPLLRPPLDEIDVQIHDTDSPLAAPAATSSWLRRGTGRSCWVSTI